MYRSIIVPLDGSKLAEKGLAQVVSIGKAYGATVKLLRVIPPIPNLPFDVARTDTPRVLREAIKTRALDYLEKISQDLKGQGIEASVSLIEEDPALGIVDEVAKTADSLIVMGTHGWSGEERWNLGSVTLKVLQTSSAPVLVVPGLVDVDPQGNLSTIFVTLDGSSLSESALPHAVSLCQKLSLDLVLLRVVPTSWEYFPNLDHTILHYGDFSRDLAERAESYLSGVAQRLQGQGLSRIEYRILRGHPAEEIIDLADGVPGGMVVMASHGQGSSVTYRWSIGSVAQRVAGSCKKPVLVVGRS